MTDWFHLLAFARAKAPAQPLALATLVRRHGSSYRAPGARLLIAADGTYAGTLSGGCLEDAIAPVGQRVLALDRCEALSIDTRPHFGCPGRLEIWIEPLRSAPVAELPRELPPLLATLADRLVRRLTTHLVTPFAPSATPALATPSTHIANAADDTRAQPDTTTAATTSPAASSDVLHEVVPPLPRLLIIGWTSDALPLAQLAAALAWEVWRIVPTAELAEPASPPARVNVAVCAPAEVPLRFAPDARTAVLVMTHHLGRDTAYLSALAPLPYPYLGLLGSRARRETVLGELGEAGLLADPTLSERLFAPAGLDLGANTPEAIALAILAEIHAHWHQRSGGFLRDRTGPIHALSRG